MVQLHPVRVRTWDPEKLGEWLAKPLVAHPETKVEGETITYPQLLGQFLGMPLDADARLIARLRSVTSAEVQAVASKYFGDDQMTQATLLPQPMDPNRRLRAAPAAPTTPSRH